MGSIGSNYVNICEKLPRFYAVCLEGNEVTEYSGGIESDELDKRLYLLERLISVVYLQLLIPIYRERERERTILGTEKRRKKVKVLEQMGAYSHKRMMSRWQLYGVATS